MQSDYSVWRISVTQSECSRIPNSNDVLTFISAMIQLQPDVIVARLSQIISSTTLVPTNDRNMALESSNSARIASETQSEIDTSKGVVETPHIDIVRRQYQYWTKSPSLIQFLMGSLQYWSRYEAPKGKQQLTIRVKYQCPAWLSERAWDTTTLRQSHAGWKFYLRSYRELPNGHEIFKSAALGILPVSNTC